jgi:glutamyl endopeptidase
MKSKARPQFEYSPGTEEAPVAVEDIIGLTDDRQQVLNTLTQDLRMLVRLRVVIPGLPPRRATGFMISPNTVLTAGHALCSRLVTGQVVRATQAFAAAASAASNQHPFGDLTCSQFEVSKQFLASQDPLFDYGAVRLPEALGNRIGFFGVRIFADNQLQNRPFVLSGFPDPAPPVPPDRPAILEDTMWAMSGPVAGTPQFLTYAMDATTGQSGAPLYSRFQENGRTVFLAAGLHQGGNFQQNHAVRFRPEILKEIGTWLQ